MDCSIKVGGKERLLLEYITTTKDEKKGRFKIKVSFAGGEEQREERERKKKVVKRSGEG